MRVSKAASRYAKALLDLASEKKKTDEVHADMNGMIRLINELPEFRSMLNSRVIKDEKKLSVMSSALTGKVCELTLRFVELLAKKGRMRLMHEIAFDYNIKYELMNRILRIKLICAHAPDDETKNKIKAAIKSESWKEIIFEEQVDESIIGGFVLRTDYVQFDAAVKSKLEEIKQSFLNKTVTA